MSSTVTDQPATSASTGNWESSRREKLRTHRRSSATTPGARGSTTTLPIADIRARAGEITFKTQDGRAGRRCRSRRRPLPISISASGSPNKAPAKWSARKVRAAGRIVLHRDKGKLQFIDIRDMTGQIQLFVGQQQVGDDWELAKCLDLGDIIGVDGELRRTKTGELSIFAERLTILTKSLAAPPEKHHGLTDPELRQRLRYLDLTYGEGVMPRFLNRTKIVRSIRETLAQRGFVEVEGPTLHSIAGGAAARPFKTHHNALDIDLFLRIALELHLKRLMVGGIERVYELGRVYRNEGISQRHNPEFTMLEAYQAYGDYRSMMDLTEACIVDAIRATGQPLVLAWGDKTIDFTPPFARKTYDELFTEHTGIDADRPGGSRRRRQVARPRNGRQASRTSSRAKSSKPEIEKSLVGPIFVMRLPGQHLPAHQAQGR